MENLLKMVISAEEEERKRIARGLHDETMQSLSALLMKIDMCSKMYADVVPSEKIDEMRNIALKTLDEIHSLIQNLRPTVVDDLGLEAGIRWLLDKHLAEKGITCDFNVIGAEEKRFNHRIETALFRIIQEAVINISKHASAENVFIVLQYMSDSIAVHMEDDGKGFDAADVLKHTDDVRGLGIMGMRERAYLVDGKLKICSTPATEQGSASGFPCLNTGINMSKTRVMIVDDHALVREGIAAFLKMSADIEVIGEAADGIEAIEGVKKLNPDIVIMDIAMPKLGGLEALVEIKKINPDVKVLVLTQYEDKEYIKRFLKAGASGYMLKRAVGLTS